MRRGTALLVATLAANAGHAQTNQELQQKLERTQQQLEQAIQVIRELQGRVNSLEKTNAARPAQTLEETAVRPSTEAGAPVIAPNLKPENNVAKAEDARIEISGHVMLDAIYDFDRVDPDWNSTLRPSKIPVYCPDNGLPREAGCGEDGETVFSIRQTKLALKGFFPTDLGELKTVLEADLYDVGGGGTHGRVLHAWGELGAFGAGQSLTLFMDIDTFPNTIEYWGPPGMVFVRNPQLRYTPYDHDGLKVAFSLEAPGAALDTGKINLIDPALGEGVDSHTELPDLIANVRYEGNWGHVQAAALVRKLSFDTPSNPNAEPSNSENGYGLNLSGVWNTHGDDRIVAQVVAGRGIASYMNDGGTDLAPDSRLQAEAVDTLGWLLYYDHYWSEQWSSSIGYSEHSQDNTSGQLFNAFKKGRYSSVNLLYYPVKNMTTGAEFLWGERENKDGNTGEDRRIQFSTKYAF